MKKRPVLITLIAAFFIILGLLSLIWSGLIFVGSGLTSAFSGLFSFDAINETASSGVWSGFFGIVAGIVQIAVGIGLVRMSSWSWYLAVLAIGLSVVQGFIGLFNGGTFALLCGVIWLLIPAGLLVYLTRASMREMFGVGSK